MDVQRVLDSDFFALSSPEEFKVGFALWAKAWTQIPAASLPDDPRILARLAGVSLMDWDRLGGMALHGWVKCADGRLYHPVVAEKALDAWAARQRQRKRAADRWARNATGNAVALPPAPKTDAAGTENGCRGNANREGEGEVNKNNPPNPPEPATTRRKPEVKIPDGFPDEQALADARARVKGAGKNLDVAVQADRFRNHAEQTDRRCRDWRAAWRNWIGSSIERAPASAYKPQAGAPVSLEAAIDIWRSRMRELTGPMRWWDDRWGVKPLRIDKQDPRTRVPDQVLKEFGFPVKGVTA
jgi:hypothetical protein